MEREGGRERERERRGRPFGMKFQSEGIVVTPTEWSSSPRLMNASRGDEMNSDENCLDRIFDGYSGISQYFFP